MEDQTKKITELTKMSSTYKLIITKELEDKIRYLCQKIWKDEWSGTLFYTHEGKFEDGSLVIKGVDLFLMDVGSAAYTEFDMSPDVISYMTDNPELLECQMGLIHSHNQMATFFSGTDLTTLREEGEDRNHFVSLIVNNAGNYTAAITRKVKSCRNVTDNYSYNSFEDTVIDGSKNYTYEFDTLEYYNLDIEIEDSRAFKDSFNSRIEEISNNKKQKLSVSTITTPLLNSNKNKTLFDGIDDKRIDYDYIDNKLVEEDAIYESLTLDDNITKNVVLQLLTGSIVIPNDSKININKWVLGMPNIFKKRFGSGREGTFNFRNWAEAYIEYLCYFTKDNKLFKFHLNEEEIASICAKSVKNYLKKLPTNEYIKIYLEILDNFII